MKMKPIGDLVLLELDEVQRKNRKRNYFNG
jgi:hypothetical protein